MYSLQNKHVLYLKKKKRKHVSNEYFLAKYVKVCF